MKKHPSKKQLSGGKLWAVILAAGQGSRMASLTRVLYGRDLPKQFAALDGDRTFLQRTMDRIAPLFPADQTLVVVSDAYESLAREQLRDYPGVHIILQPDNRGTGPGVLLPLAHVSAGDSEARIVIFPSDHHVQRPGQFLEAVGQSLTAADEAPSGIALIGAVAHEPATDLGWIVPKSRSGDSLARARSVERFVEKPRSAEAWALLEAGGLWNTMIVTGRVGAFWRLLRTHLPEQTQEIERYSRMLGQPEARTTLEKVYQSLQPADFSRAVLQSALGLSVVPMVDAGWSDCGTPKRLFECLKGTSALKTLATRLRDASKLRNGTDVLSVAS